MLAKTPINQQFYNWVCSKDPNETYNYQSCSECACGRFATEALGIVPDTKEFKEVWDTHFWGKFDRDTSVPSLNFIARGTNGPVMYSKNWTFGNLRARLEKMLPECVG